MVTLKSAFKKSLGKRKHLLTNHDKAVQTLTSLGLSFLQAKVYLALVAEGVLTIKNLARTSQVARQDLYRITLQLLNRGLVEKVVDVPTRFKAVPIETAIGTLIERRKKETAALEQESKDVIRSFAALNEKCKLKNEETQITVISDLQSRITRGKKQVDAAQENIQIVTKWSFFLAYTLENIREFTRALNRGVKIQVVTQKHEEAPPIPKSLQALTKYPLFEIRYLNFPPSSIVAVFDRQEANIMLLTASATKSGAITTNNPSLIELARNYFETVWSNATAGDIYTNNNE